MRKNHMNSEVYEGELKELKGLFRTLCGILDNYSFSPSFYTQIDKREDFSKEEKRFLKRLNNEIEDTNTGCVIKEIAKKRSNLKEILIRMESPE